MTHSVLNVLVQEPELLVANLPDASKQEHSLVLGETGAVGVCHVAAVEEVAVNT